MSVGMGVGVGMSLRMSLRMCLGMGLRVGVSVRVGQGRTVLALVVAAPIAVVVRAVLLGHGVWQWAMVSRCLLLCLLMVLGRLLVLLVHVSSTHDRGVWLVHWVDHVGLFSHGSAWVLRVQR